MTSDDCTPLDVFDTLWIYGGIYAGCIMSFMLTVYIFYVVFGDLFK